jgi:(2R)-sulfolactate sulfo-lyase subunit alpha
MAVSFLVHHPRDNVGVAVEDIPSTLSAVGGYRDGEGELQLAVLEPVPLGHKIALDEVPAGGDVVEYGVVIGVATADIAKGQLVHVHNLKGRRWA